MSLVCVFNVIVISFYSFSYFFFSTHSVPGSHTEDTCKADMVSFHTELVFQQELKAHEGAIGKSGDVNSLRYIG